MKRFILLGFIFHLSFSYAQDSVKISHPYKKSMMFSAFVPGAGQIRNSFLSQKKFKNAYWKIPIIYGALGSSAYMIYENNRIQRSIKEEYYSREAGNDPSLEWINYDSYGLIALQQQFLNNRDLFLLLTLGLHGLQILDAGVEAHFLNFNVDKNLNVQLRPIFNKNSLLVSANFTFK